MKPVNSKSKLAIILSKLKPIPEAKIKLEQYTTDSETAADLLWKAFMQGDIKDKVIADLGCGTGILGIGCLLLGAKFVYFVDIDEDVLKILRENLDELNIDKKNYSIINTDIKDLELERVDLVIQNPPFGTKTKHADREFLEKAFQLANTIYSFHKTSTKGFVKAISEDHNYNIEQEYKYNLSLKQMMKFHKKRIQRIQVSCFRLTGV